MATWRVFVLPLGATRGSEPPALLVLCQAPACNPGTLPPAIERALLAGADRPPER